jgi:hypothetical protein
MSWSEIAGLAGKELRWSRSSKDSTKWGLYRCLKANELTYDVTSNRTGVTIQFPIGPAHYKVCVLRWVLVPGSDRNYIKQMSGYAPI